MVRLSAPEKWNEDDIVTDLSSPVVSGDEDDASKPGAAAGAGSSPPSAGLWSSGAWHEPASSPAPRPVRARSRRERSRSGSGGDTRDGVSPLDERALKKHDSENGYVGRPLRSRSGRSAVSAGTGGGASVITDGTGSTARTAASRRSLVSTDRPVPHHGFRKVGNHPETATSRQLEIVQDIATKDYFIAKSKLDRDLASDSGFAVGTPELENYRVFTVWEEAVACEMARFWLPTGGPVTFTPDGKTIYSQELQGLTPLYNWMHAGEAPPDRGELIPCFANLEEQAERFKQYPAFRDALLAGRIPGMAAVHAFWTMFGCEDQQWGNISTVPDGEGGLRITIHEAELILPKVYGDGTWTPELDTTGKDGVALERGRKQMLAGAGRYRAGWGQARLAEVRGEPGRYAWFDVGEVKHDDIYGHESLNYCEVRAYGKTTYEGQEPVLFRAIYEAYHARESALRKSMRDEYWAMCVVMLSTPPDVVLYMATAAMTEPMRDACVQQYYGQSFDTDECVAKEVGGDLSDERRAHFERQVNAVVQTVRNIEEALSFARLELLTIRRFCAYVADRRGQTAIDSQLERIESLKSAGDVPLTEARFSHRDPEAGLGLDQTTSSVTMRDLIEDGFAALRKAAAEEEEAIAREEREEAEAREKEEETRPTAPVGAGAGAAARPGTVRGGAAAPATARKYLNGEGWQNRLWVLRTEGDVPVACVGNDVAETFADQYRGSVATEAEQSRFRVELMLHLIQQALMLEDGELTIDHKLKVVALVGFAIQQRIISTATELAEMGVLVNADRLGREYRWLHLKRTGVFSREYNLQQQIYGNTKRGAAVHALLQRAILALPTIPEALRPQLLAICSAPKTAPKFGSGETSVAAFNRKFPPPRK